jgi:hypothetical protein
MRDEFNVVIKLQQACHFETLVRIFKAQVSAQWYKDTLPSQVRAHTLPSIARVLADPAVRADASWDDDMEADMRGLEQKANEARLRLAHAQKKKLFALAQRLNHTNQTAKLDPGDDGFLSRVTRFDDEYMGGGTLDLLKERFAMRIPSHYSDALAENMTDFAVHNMVTCAVAVLVARMEADFDLLWTKNRATRLSKFKFSESASTKELLS